MATFDEARISVLNEISSVLQEEYPDLTNVYRIVMDGLIKTVSRPENLGTQDRIVLYKEAQESNFDPVIETVVGCLEIYEDGTNPTGTYNEITPGTITYDSNPALRQINFNLGNPAGGNCPAPPLAITDLFLDDEYFGVTQNIHFDNRQVEIDTEKARQVLDLNIRELAPQQRTRQQRINQIFSEINELLGEKPSFDLDVDADGAPDTWTNYVSGSQAWSETSDISLDNPDGNIVRLRNDGLGTSNEGKTVEELRNKLTDYLTDIDKQIIPTPQDERPLYENKTEGYLGIRNLNQSIIIRKEEGDEVDLSLLKTVSGEDTALLAQGYGVGQDIPSYLYDGFTITMWVRFLDRVSSGTLFNFGNPLRDFLPKGLMLETYSLFRDDIIPSTLSTTGDGTMITWGEFATNENITYRAPGGNDIILFSDTSNERFIRLIVKEDLSSPSFTNLRGSHLGNVILPRSRKIPNAGNTATETELYSNDKGLLFNTRIPIDFNEWFFICASYNPLIDEDNSDFDDVAGNDFPYRPDYWRNNINTDNTYTVSSGYGAKCKVEFISKSDLLRARGFRQE